MYRSYDVIVAGVGGMGSAAMYHLAKRGQRVRLIAESMLIPMSLFAVSFLLHTY